MLKQMLSPFRKLVYQLTGKKPWSYGYNDSRWSLIAASIRDRGLLEQFGKASIPAGYGIGFDERVAEYPWIFSKLQHSKGQLLDAGSTFNFPQIVTAENIKQKALTIFTYYPEPNNFSAQRISYVYGDLRSMCFKNGYFDEVVCQSTIEHIDMDNSIYGYDLPKNENVQTKSYQYLEAVAELVRVTKPKGRFLLTFPYGKFEHHGFFQQFDAEMVQRIFDTLAAQGTFKDEYLLYTTSGWTFATADACRNSESYNPHTGKGKGADGAAHCRAVCCIEFIKH